ncbi:MAG: FCD domain-containing protein, partial [Deltaproteobacteria bacterium]
GPFELMEARLAVEASAAALASQKATNYDIMELEAIIARMTHATGNGDEAEVIDHDFHLSIANLTGNAIIVSMVEAMWSQRKASKMWKRLREHIHTETNGPLWIGDHTAIVAALKMRNADAAYKAMARHISNVANELLEADDRGRFAGEG